MAERLVLAVEHASIEEVQRLLAARADVESTSGGRGNETPLAITAKVNRRAVAALLLDAGATTESTDDDGFTPLMWAAFEGHADVVRLLCEAGADTEVEDADGNTPLLVATLAGHEQAVRALCEAGADVGGRSSGVTALAVARGFGHTEIVAILERRADDYKRGGDESGGDDGQISDDDDTMDYDVEEEEESLDALDPVPQDADTHPYPVDEARGDDYDGDGVPPPPPPSLVADALYWAAAKGDVPGVRRLLDAKADLEYQNKASGCTPLLVACRNKGKRQIAVAQLLLEAGANMEARNAKDGSTPLMMAVQEDKDLFKVDLCELLLQHGADPYAARRDGKRPLDLAEELRAAWWMRTDGKTSVDTTVLKRLLGEAMEGRASTEEGL